jgi:voltage-gated potassium channel
VVQRAARLLLSGPLTARRAGSAIAVVTVVVTIASAAGMRLVDANEFPSFGRSLWWAVQTVTTVGYGDAVPTSVAGRLLAALVMVTGIAFVTVVTAAITAAFVESARSRLRGARSDEALEARLDEIATRLERIESALERR